MLISEINIRAAAPTFYPLSGNYQEYQDVTVSSATGSTTIYYTSDGTTPSDSSIPYTIDTGGITASQSTFTVTADGAIFTSAMVGRRIVWGTSEEARITAYSDTTHVTVDVSQTVASGGFVIDAILVSEAVSIKAIAYHATLDTSAPLYG